MNITIKILVDDIWYFENYNVNEKYRNTHIHKNINVS